MGDICLLTVVHSTRIEADITRDSRCLKGEKRNFLILYFLSIFVSLFSRYWLSEADYGDPDSDARSASDFFLPSTTKHYPEM